MRYKNFNTHCYSLKSLLDVILDAIYTDIPGTTRRFASGVSTHVNDRHLPYLPPIDSVMRIEISLFKANLMGLGPQTFCGQLSCKIWAFSGKYHVKFGHFVNF